MVRLIFEFFLAVEDELDQQIKKLKRYRENGITTLKGKLIYSSPPLILLDL